MAVLFGSSIFMNNQTENNTILSKKEKRKAYDKEYYQKNIERILKEKKDYQKKNREPLKAYLKEYKQKNKETLREKRKESYQRNREQILERKKESHQRNKKQRNEQIYLYQKNRRKNDIEFKIRTNLRSRILAVLKTQKSIKSSNTINLLGCSLEEARKHLESQFKEGMTWENHGNKGWHIDHIRPCASFDLTDIEQQRDCFNYKNLQPLWWNENLSKGDKWLG